MLYKNLPSIYCLLVCFVCTIIGIICLGFLVSHTLDFIFVETMHPEVMAKYSSNESFIETLRREHTNWEYTNEVTKQKILSIETMDDEQLTQKRLKELNESLNMKKDQAIASLLKSLGIFLVAVIFFLAHWTLFWHFKKAS
jgi:predicted PurR-regulated permease PerM